MSERLIQSEGERRKAVRVLEAHRLPFRFVIRDGRDRSVDQNALQWKWAAEVADHIEGKTTSEIQREWKRRFGVPILIGENVRFAAWWLAFARMHSYEVQVEMMEFFEVSSVLSTTGFANYLDQILRHYTSEGIKLTVPIDKRWGSGEAERVDRGGPRAPTPRLEG